MATVLPPAYAIDADIAAIIAAFLLYRLLYADFDIAAAMHMPTPLFFADARHARAMLLP